MFYYFAHNLKFRYYTFSILAVVLTFTFVAKWKVGGFLFQCIFIYASHTFDFFLYFAVAEPVWMESVSVAWKVRDGLPSKFSQEIRNIRRMSEDFLWNSLAAWFCGSTNPGSTFATGNRFILLRRIAQAHKKEEKNIQEKQRGRQQRLKQFKNNNIERGWFYHTYYFLFAAIINYIRCLMDRHYN